VADTLGEKPMVSTFPPGSRANAGTGNSEQIGRRRVGGGVTRWRHGKKPAIEPCHNGEAS
jgi:hypothetical protein